MTNWVYVKSNSYLYRVFGDRPIKVDSLIPAVPREEGAPPCYWVLATDLSDAEILQLSILLYEQWKPECKSIADAEAYIKEKNLPPLLGIMLNALRHLRLALAFRLLLSTRSNQRN